MNLPSNQTLDKRNLLAQTLERIDRSERADRIGIVVAGLAIVGFTLWLPAKHAFFVETNIHAAFTKLYELIVGSMLVVVCMVALASIKLKLELRRSTKAILQALEEVRKVDVDLHRNK